MPPSGVVTDTDTGYGAIKAELESLANSYVIIGFQEGTVTHAQTKGKRSKKAGQSVAEIAAQNEFGTNRIPARSFMRTSFDENRQRIEKAVQGEYGKILDGHSTVKKSLGLLGLFMVDLIQRKIYQIHYPPNSPTTIQMKGSSKPLIDFGQMVASVASKVVIK
jgi:hypothetical protein